MRLVDADALDWAFTSLRWRDGELLHWGDRPNWCLVGEEVEKLIADAPTVDAIPVEWMREKMQKPQMTCANPFSYVLAEWLEEQEAR